MLELINTSVPCGLIAGARGFATVAMSRGLNERTRLQLEELCSYAHRTSAHDERYWRENPVHWFHLILKQGEHVLGRVAPAEFDYTGRTNRLGHVVLLREAEMPACGGIALLREMKAALATPWSGEPHYLEETPAPPVPMPSVGGTAHWQELLGADGAAMAQRLAWHLLRQAQSATPAPIYFKLSTVWDASGEKALNLFDELIALLPPTQQAKITFSTYASTLPMGARACYAPSSMRTKPLPRSPRPMCGWTARKGASSMPGNFPSAPPPRKRQTLRHRGKKRRPP